MRKIKSFNEWKLNESWGDVTNQIKTFMDLNLVFKIEDIDEWLELSDSELKKKMIDYYNKNLQLKENCLFEHIVNDFKQKYKNKFEDGSIKIKDEKYDTGADKKILYLLVSTYVKYISVVKNVESFKEDNLDLINDIEDLGYKFLYNKKDNDHLYICFVKNNTQYNDIVSWFPYLTIPRIEFKDICNLSDSDFRNKIIELYDKQHYNMRFNKNKNKEWIENE